MEYGGSIFKKNWLVRDRYLKGGFELESWFDGVPITKDKADIISHIIPARTHALGQRFFTNSNSVINEAISLGYGSSNQGHSGQFHGTYADRQKFWRDVLARSLELMELEGEYTGLK